MRLAAFGLAALLLPAVAVAQEQTAADLVARFLAGAEQGSTFILDVDFSQIVLERNAPGSYGGATADGDFAFVVTEGETCVFDVAITYWGTRTSRVAFDANQLSAVVFTPGETLEFEPPVTSYVLDFSGGERLFTLPDSIGADGLPQVGPSQLWIMTSLGLHEMQAALAAFRADHCPGLAG